MSSPSNDALGPLAGLLGTWEGSKGTDTSPDDVRTETEVNEFRERMVFEPTGEVANHEQKLQGLRYALTAWRIGAEDPFHEDRGYYLWDPAEKQVMRCFAVPRGVSMIAGGSAEAGDTSFSLSAELGSQTYGILSNPFLDREFKTVRFEMKLELRDANTLYYRQDTVLDVKGRDGLFHHTDENTLGRVGS